MHVTLLNYVTLLMHDTTESCDRCMCVTLLMHVTLLNHVTLCDTTDACETLNHVTLLMHVTLLILLMHERAKQLAIVVWWPHSVGRSNGNSSASQTEANQVVLGALCSIMSA